MRKLIAIIIDAFVVDINPFDIYAEENDEFDNEQINVEHPLNKLSAKKH